MAVAGNTVIVITAEDSPFYASLRKAEAAAGASSRSISQKFSKAGAGLSRVGRNMTRYVTLPIIAAGAAAVKTAVDFDDAFTKISALSNTSEKDVARFRKEVLKLSRQTAKSPKELADALYFLVSAGLKSSQVMGVLEASAQASASGLGETQDIARLTAVAMNAYSKEGLKATEVIDTLIASVREGTAEPDEFANALGRILPIAQKAQVSFDEVTASLASLSNIGLDVNEGVTAMRGLLMALEAPGTQAAKTMASVGISTDEMRAAIADQGILGALRLLDEATEGNIDTMRKIVPNVRALTGQFGLLGQNADKVDAVFHNVADSSGSLDKAFGTTRKSEGFKLRQLLAQIQTLGVRLGTKALPVIRDIVREVGHGVRWFTNLDKGLQSNIIKWGLLAAAMGPVLRLFGGFLKMGGGVARILERIAGGAATGAAGSAAGAGVAKGVGAGAVGRGLLSGASGPLALAASGAAAGYWTLTQAGGRGIIPGALPGDEAVEEIALIQARLATRAQDAIGPEGPGRYNIRDAISQIMVLGSQMDRTSSEYEQLVLYGNRLRDTWAAQKKELAGLLTSGRLTEHQFYRQAKAIGLSTEEMDEMARAVRQANLEPFAKSLQLTTRQVNRLARVAGDTKAFRQMGKSFGLTKEEIEGLRPKLQGLLKLFRQGADTEAPDWAKQIENVGDVARDLIDPMGLSEQETIRLIRAAKDGHGPFSTMASVLGLNERQASAMWKQLRNAANGMDALANSVRDFPFALFRTVMTADGGTIQVPNITSPYGNGGPSKAPGSQLPGPTASGGIFVGRQIRQVGDGMYHTRFGKGAEAVVPLTDRVLGAIGEAISGGGRSGPLRISGELHLRNGRAYIDGIATAADERGRHRDARDQRVRQQG